MNHKRRVLFYALLAVVLALIATGEQPSLAEGSIIYVDADATGANNGTSWADAFTSLQPGLDAAISGDQIWVAEGTYLPAHEFTPGDPRSVSFQIKNGVAIYGGFDGTETTLTDRDWMTNLTILSCDLNGDDGLDFANNAENCYHVFFHPGGTNLDSSAILDGFTITGGNANGASYPYYYDRGGGMYNDHSSPTVTNATFSGNSANNGGGMYNDDSSPTVTNAIFSSNSAVGFGGGMYNWESSPTLVEVTFSANSADMGGGMFNNWNSNTTLTDVTFSCNTATTAGGGMVNSYSNITLNGATFSGNSGGYYGGGMYNIESSPILTDIAFSANSAYNGGGMDNDDSNPTLINATFSGNTAPGDGGGMHNNNSDPTLTNVTFSGNTAGSDGGGMYNLWGSSPTLTNAILWGNTPDQICGDVSIITYSDIQGGYPGTGNINLDPLFVDALNGDFHLNLNSPCIDAGDNEALNLPLYDFEGDDRICDGDSNGVATVDMGVDEAKLYRVYLPMILRWPDW